MSIADVKALVAAHGGPDAVFAMVFDNNYFVRFSKNRPYDESEFKTYGETEVLERQTTVQRRSTHMLNVPMTTVYNMECLQEVLFVNDATDRDDISSTEFLSLK